MKSDLIFIQFILNRTEEEYKKGHVHNSLNIPYMFNTPQGLSSFFCVCIFISKLGKMNDILVILGRVKNPKFMEQVSSACDKEEKLIVVIHLIIIVLFIFQDKCYVCNLMGNHSGMSKWCEVPVCYY